MIIMVYVIVILVVISGGSKGNAFHMPHQTKKVAEGLQTLQWEGQ